MEVLKKNTEEREKELEKLYGGWVKALDNKDMGIGIVYFDVEQIRTRRVDYGRAGEYMIMIVLNCLEISKKYGNEQIGSLVRLEGATVKNFSYKFVKYISNLVSQAFPGRLKVAHIMEPNSKIYKSLVIAFFKMMKYCIHKEAYEKLKLLKAVKNH